MSGKTVTKLLAVDEYVVIDTETTGLDVKWCEIIEIAAKRVSGGRIIDTFESLVKPSALPLDPFIEGYTGISTEMLMSAPEINVVLPSFLSFIGDSVLVGQNVTFDARFISAALGASLDNDLVDTKRISHHVYKELPGRSLPDIYSKCVEEGCQQVEGRSHRAGFDTEVTQLVYEHMKPLLIELYGDNPEEGWEQLGKSQRAHSSKTKKGDIVQTVDEIDDSNPFYGSHVCFTGKMSSMTRPVAWQKLVNLGGIIEENAVQTLDYLVIGNEGFASNVKGNKSEKIKKTEANQLRGFPVQIISEDFFLEFAKDV